MPTRNEARYIERSLRAVLSQDYPPDCLEVLVVDGKSTDDTAEIVRRMIAKLTAASIRPVIDGAAGTRASQGRPSIILLDNPARTAPAALNLGLLHARGRVIIRVDGHCEIATDYVRQCVRFLANTNVACVGGPIKTLGENMVARGIALAMSSSFGVGNARFRISSKEEYVDTVAFGAYRREVFEQVGPFDEEMIRNQDDEFNFRLAQAGHKILMTPAIHSVYYSRASFRGLWKQYFEYGFWKVRVMQKRRGVPSWRSLVPPTFALALVGVLPAGILAGSPLWTVLFLGLYLGASLGTSLWIAFLRGLGYLPVLLLSFLILHLGYGCGFWVGLFHFGARRRSGSLGSG